MSAHMLARTSTMPAAVQCSTSGRAAALPCLVHAGRVARAPASRAAPAGRRALQVAAAFRAVAPPSNPAYNFGNLDNELAYSDPRSEPMTIEGTVNKGALLLGITAIAASYTWMQVFSAGSMAAVMGVINAAKLAGIGSLISALAVMFKPQWSPFTGPIYAVCQGIALAGLSAAFELKFPGIAMQAVLLTMGTAASCMIALKAKWIQVNEGFTNTVRTVMGGYFIVMLAGFLASMVGFKLPSMLTSGPIGIAIGLVSAGLAAANLLIDFQFLKDTSREGAPKWMEWYGAQSVAITLSWLYIDMLRLLANFAGLGGNQE